MPQIQADWPAGQPNLQHTTVLAIPETSRNYLHLLISESDLQLSGTATDESLRFWSSRARLDKYTYRWKRDRMQTHISGSQPNCKHTFWKHNETKTRQQRSVVQIPIWIKIQIKYKLMNSARTSNYSATSLNQAPIKKRKILKTSLAKHASAC